MHTFGRSPGREINARVPAIPPMAKFEEARINAGMITTIDPADIPSGALQLAQNAVVRFDVTQRRLGSSLIDQPTLDSNPVLRIAAIKTKSGDPFTIRFTPTTISFLTTSSWNKFLISSGLSGTANDRFTMADVLDTFVFANNGANPIQKIDLATNTVSKLGNALPYRYVTGFFNRVVGFALRGQDETQVGWSGDGVPDQWDPNVDISAGFSPLIDTPDDLSDFIKGGLAFSNVMIILREKSIWLANKQPIADDPFYFYSTVPGIGCDAPFSAKLVSGDAGQLVGVAWVDRRTGTVYAYAPGYSPDPIGRPIEKDLIGSIEDSEQVFSAFSPANSEYTVFIPDVSGITKGWTFNFKSKAWTYNEYVALTSVDDTEFQAAGLTIDELVGTIDGLTGTIDELSGPTFDQIVRSYGHSDGSVSVERTTDNADGTSPFTSIFVSKAFTIPEVDALFAKIVLEYQITDVDTITIEYSTDGGVSNWVTAKTITPTVVGRPVLFILRRVIRARRLAWRVSTKAAGFKILNYEVHIYPSGQSRQ